MQTIYLDISNKGVVPTIYAKQGDVGRKFEVVLTDSGLPYIPTSGSAFSVWYSGTSGEGNYTKIGSKSAFSVNGNKVIVEMIAQMLSNDGEGILSLVLNDNGGNQIGLWSIRYVCESVPGANSEEAKEYYTAFSESVKKLSDTEAILKSKLSVDGSNAMEANLSMGSHRVTELGEPAADGDAVPLGFANKNFAPVSHATDKNNPHGVTAEQVGALPMSGGTVTGNGDTPLYLKSSTFNSYIGFKNFSDKLLGYLGIAEDGTPIFYDTGIKTLLHSDNIASFAAPPDYGLGATTPPTITTTEQLDACCTSGFYRYAITGSKVGGIGLNFGALAVYTVNGNECVQELRPLNTNYCLRRYWYNGSWSEWEVENPPMSLGVEYRTTERWNGEPIYTKLADLGAVTESCTLSMSAPGLTALVRAVPHLGKDGCAEWDSDSGINVANAFYYCPGISGQSVTFYIKCGTNRVGSNFKAQIWYTK